MSDSYRTIDGQATATLKVEGSRFLAEAFPIEDREEAEDRIQAVRQREHGATHHCTAYRLGVEGDDFRYNDDGEPSGTAGRPILRQIDAETLTNVLVVVSRYYGGTKLGTGGLMRAYGDAAAAALARATVVQRIVRVPVCVRFSYEDTNPAQQVLRRFDATEMGSQYTDVTELTVGIPASDVDAFVEAFTNALAGRGTIVRVGTEGKDEGTDGRGESSDVAFT